MEPLHLPNLEQKTLAIFDSLASQEKIFYEEAPSELITINGFDFQFIIAGILNKKPILPANAPSRKKAGGPFINPNPEEIITELGATHRLLVNKWGIFRPMTVIPTTHYALQTDDLDMSDVNAAWSVLKAFETPSLIIYNCGVNAGSSQGHKHTQVFPLPVHALWPSRAHSCDDVSTNIANVPFKHFSIRLPSHADTKTAYEAYIRLLELSRETLARLGEGSRDYNVAMTADWITVIPRRSSEGPYGANAAGMLGIVYLPDQQERDRWAQVGYTKQLEAFGIPVHA
ncbi:hypothetical protein D6C91_06972 [Aureobasidium pullulans]|uniref:Uncharacterized protein n=1 Tax=Aureobasidium pullulans TaxID=5580 RepID=A0A4S9STE1_AURPU|nr:hypothetical protein D6C91_06972 [Aureobasidium pullulans]